MDVNYASSLIETLCQSKPLYEILCILNIMFVFREFNDWLAQFYGLEVESQFISFCFPIASNRH